MRRFLLGFRRIIAEIRVADDAVAEAQREERFGNAGRQGDDAADRLRNAHRAARFVRYFTGSGSGCIVSRHGLK